MTLHSEKYSFQLLKKQTPQYPTKQNTNFNSRTIQIQVQIFNPIFFSTFSTSFYPKTQKRFLGTWRSNQTPSTTATITSKRFSGASWSSSGEDGGRESEKSGL